MKTAELSERDRLLDEVATAYLKAAESGQKPAPQEWLARYPHLAVDLEIFFAEAGLV